MPDLVEAIKCSSCGGPLKLSAGDILVTCPYCGTISRISGERPFLLRHSMLTFRLDQAGAQAAIAGWMEGGFMKPDDLRRASRVTSLECVYVPFYVFEVDVATAYSGVLTRTGTNERLSGSLPGNYFWKVLARRTGDFPVREYKLPLAYKVEFSTGGMVPGSRFLNAELDEDEGARIAREEVDVQQRELLKDRVDVLEQGKTDITVKDTEFLHAPLWFATYVYHGRTFHIILDAASGEVVLGDIPPPSGGLKEFLLGR